jgi:hypothetical protein
MISTVVAGCDRILGAHLHTCRVAGQACSTAGVDAAAVAVLAALPAALGTRDIHAEWPAAHVLSAAAVDIIKALLCPALALQAKWPCR